MMIVVAVSVGGFICCMGLIGYCCLRRVRRNDQWVYGKQKSNNKCCCCFNRRGAGEKRQKEAQINQQRFQKAVGKINAITIKKPKKENNKTPIDLEQAFLNNLGEERTQNAQIDPTLIGCKEEPLNKV